MVRRKKVSLAEDILTLGTLIPWWLSTALAVIIYFALNAVAQAPAEIVAVTRPQDMAQMLTRKLWTTLATIGQYLLPLLLLTGAGISAVSRYRRATLLNNVVGGDEAAALAVLNAMSWQEFEQVVGQWFRQEGYAVEENRSAGADGGVDLKLSKGNERFLVQCKQWRATKVGVTVVRELYGIMAAQGVAGGFVITSGRFTAEALEFAAGRNVQLYDGDYLARIMLTAVAPERLHSTQPVRVVQDSPASALPCPLCGGKMCYGPQSAAPVRAKSSSDVVRTQHAEAQQKFDARRRAAKVSSGKRHYTPLADQTNQLFGLTLEANLANSRGALDARVGMSR